MKPGNEPSAEIRFVLDGEAVSLRDVDPTRTVLQYLREDLGRTGTKEGCAEGDCGACTVVVVDIDADNTLRPRAINACIQFLPALHGKELLTVESLGRPGALHPVQSALVDHHGSQCGFCTPGFVMSMFALYKTAPAPSRNDIEVALAGNLCRCTGYRPIVDAAQAMYSAPRTAPGWLQEPATRSNRPATGSEERTATLAAICDERDLALSGTGEPFYAPTSLASLDVLMTAHPGARLLAGGTDVGLWVTKQQRTLGPVVHLGRVAGLDAIRVIESHVEVGATATFTDAMPVLVEHFPALEELLRRFASPPIRNAATLGGNVANGSPIGDSMPALLALGASVVLRHEGRERELPLEDFYLAYQQTALRPGEVLVRVRIPRLGAGARFAAYKISKRFDQDISAVCASFLVVLDDDARITHARTGFGGMAAIPSRTAKCEAALLGQPWNQATLEAAVRALGDDFTPIDDMRASASYRQRVATNLLKRFFLETESEQNHVRHRL